MKTGRMKTIEKKYGKDFGVRLDKKLVDLLQDKGYDLSKLFSSKDDR